MIEAILNAVGYGAAGKQRCPALADMLEDCFISYNVQIRILLAGKGGVRQILRRGAGTYSIGIFFTKLFKMTGNLLLDTLRNSDSFDDLADFGADFINTFPVICF